VGAVIELCAGVPANWMVLVVGVTVVWALAEKDSKPNRSAMQNKNSEIFPHKKEFLFRAKTAMPIDDFTFVPSCPANLGLRDHLPRDKEGIIHFAKTIAAARSDFRRCCKNQTMTASACFAYAPASYYLIGLTQESNSAMGKYM